MAAQTFLIVDGSSLIHRAFYAMPLLTNAKGEATNAVYGFAMMLSRFLQKQRPDHAVVCFDVSRHTFRTEQFEQYKGSRKETPPELKVQFAPTRELVTAMGVAWEEQGGYEADDIMGTLAKAAAAQGFEVMILSGDKDVFQLIDDHIKIYMTNRGISDIKVWDREALQERYGLTPQQFIDLKGLMGDSSDNIPGVPGIGEKTALKLLAQYPSINEIYSHLDEVKPAGVQKKLREHQDLAFLSKELATIYCNVPNLQPCCNYQYRGPGAELEAFYRRMNFMSLLRQLQQDATPQDLPWAEKPQAPPAASGSETLDAAQLPATQLQNSTETAALAVAIQQAGQVAIWLDYQGAPFDGDVTAIGFCLDSGCYGMELLGALDQEKLRPLAQVLAREDIVKTLFAAKEAKVALAAQGIVLSGIADDCVLQAYLLDPAENHYDVDALASRYLGAELPLENDIPLWQQAAKKAGLLRPLSQQLTTALTETGMSDLYRQVELPLTSILAEMELTGVRVDGQRLQDMALELQKTEDKLTQEIYRLAGTSFNINSPKQLGHVLFEELGIPPVKKTKTGYSTDAEVLETLAVEHEIARLILLYRSYFKLRTTYAQGLPALIKADGRIHTSFNQTVTATGRLSSADPNLQNIPVRDELGRKIRRAFLPSDSGRLLLAADYSQIELRVLAHISGDEGLRRAFLQGADIHTSTAAEVFGVKPEEVTKEQRRSAKAVNFGIVYGISDFGLSRNLGIPRWEAKEYISRYLSRYPGVEQYMTEIVAQGKQDGYVTTLLGRRRYLPDLNSRNGNLRAFAQRMALNTPIQGTAADILKVAMVKLKPAVADASLQAKLLLQVHDELIFDVPKEEIQPLASLLREIMVHALDLSVPLEVDVKVGEDWYDMKPMELR